MDDDALRGRGDSAAQFVSLAAVLVAFINLLMAPFLRGSSWHVALALQGSLALISSGLAIWGLRLSSKTDLVLMTVGSVTAAWLGLLLTVFLRVIRIC